MTKSVIPALLLTAVTLTAQAPVPHTSTRFDTMRPEILGTHGIVAAGRHYSVSAGVRIMQQGGNAVDAVVATVLAASIVEISHFGFGGESPAMIYDARKKEIIVINGQGPAPKAAAPALFAAKGFVPGNGPLGATVPAMLDAMALALETKGTMHLSQVLQPAIELADGFPMYAFLHNFMVSERKATEQYDWSAKTYYPNGTIPDVGERFRQPNLAKTLRAIAAADTAAFTRTHKRVTAIRAGRDVFYKGNIAHRIVDANKAAGSVFTYEDLASYHGNIEQPTTTNFHGYDIYKAGTWNQGPVLLQTLNILEGVDLLKSGANPADYIHSVHEAIKLAYADRNAYYGDPAFTQVPIAGLLSKVYATQRRALIGAQAALEHRPGDPFRFDQAVTPPATRYTPHPQGVVTPSSSGDTTWVDVVDKDGNLVSMTPNSGWLPGGAFIAGGKRPRTTLTPALILKDGKPLLAISTPGGDSQDPQILNVLLQMIVFGKDIQDAIEAPRVNSLHPFGSFDNHLSEPDVLESKDRVPEVVRAALIARGHELKVLGPFGMSTGVVAVGVDPQSGMLRGGADPRRERYIFGW